MTRSSKTRRTDEPKLHLELYCAFSFYDYARFEHAWQMLQRPVVPSGLRYGRIQPYKHTVSSDTRVAFDLFAHDNALLFGTRDHRFQGKLETAMTGYSLVSVFIARSSWSEAWIEWVIELCSAPVLFGRACSLAEFDAKHAVGRDFPEGRASGQVGALRNDLYKFLPGIYWFTVLGKELVAALDVAAVGDVQRVDLPGGQLALRLDGDPFVKGPALEARLAYEQKIASALGDIHFFDRERQDRELRPVPAFLTALESLRPASGHPRRG
jgi:hypothetical protein